VPQIAVPKGFKLVPIPTQAAVEEPPTVSAAAETYSEIADPQKTERKIFVGGLSPVTTEKTLVEYFSTFGPVADARVIREGEKSKGFAFVQFVDATPSAVLEQSAHLIDQRRCGVGLAFHREKR
jgi:RNA recognition motif-containing protein